MNPYFNLFMRNWLNCRANENDIDEAVAKGILTESEGDEIKNTERDCDAE